MTDDLISRQAAIAAIKGHEMIELDDKRRWYNHGLLDSEVSILDMPTADVRENVRGEWIDAVVGTSTGYTYHEKRCSICGYGEVLPHNFCPNCGADMRGEQNE